ncbi:hypothetical protein EYF80_022706 [Liparis tanakae]|uniref:Uncharacterized protein n=1 Tax=Liparis tanakae TaxID=230148 RepID=A0A4Z2HN91_9TELE|nr:hypothetical protein EYF80_022706 [Liparis tanakae]
MCPDGNTSSSNTGILMVASGDRDQHNRTLRVDFGRSDPRLTLLLRKVRREGAGLGGGLDAAPRIWPICAVSVFPKVRIAMRSVEKWYWGESDGVGVVRGASGALRWYRTAGIIQGGGGSLVEEASLCRVGVWFGGAEHGDGPPVEQAATRLSLGAAASPSTAKLACHNNHHYCNQQQRTAPAEHNDDN